MPPSPFSLVEFLFSTVAHKPEPISLREGAAVARYLNELAYQWKNPGERKALLFFSNMIWEKAFQFAKFKVAQKDVVIRILKSHASWPPTPFVLGRALKIVDSSPVPKPHIPIMLVSPAMSSQYSSKKRPRISNDLS